MVCQKASHILPEKCHILPDKRLILLEKHHILLALRCDAFPAKCDAYPAKCDAYPAKCDAFLAKYVMPSGKPLALTILKYLKLSYYQKRVEKTKNTIKISEFDLYVDKM